MKVRPSTLWNLSSVLDDLGVEGREQTGHLLDFDFAALEFHEYLTSMRKQQKKVRVTNDMKLKDNQTWGPKYTDKQILDKYFGESLSYGPVSDALTPDELEDIMLDWDPSQTQYEVEDV